MNLGWFTGPMQTVAPGASRRFCSARFYAGPKDQYRLRAISPGLDFSVDYGWLWWIAQPLFYFLTKIHGLLGNWGWSIMVLTLGVKALFFWLNAKAYISMANMRRVQPKLVEIRERYADDKQKQSQEMMNLYKTEKINPIGGCLPVVVQMPVFLSLYWVLLESVELRHAPWILWIKDLSAMDPLLRAAAADGRDDVLPAKTESAAARSDAGEGDAIHADHVYLLLFMVPGRPGACITSSTTFCRLHSSTSLPSAS